MKDLKADVADVGVVVGRFQLDALHEGHLELLDTVNAAHGRLVVIVGLSHGKCTASNPLDFQSRRAMLQEQYPEATIIYVKDIHSDTLWSQDLDERILDIIGPEQSTCLYGSRDSFIPFYHGMFPTKEFTPSKLISATEIRKRLGTEATYSRDFRRGACWAMANQWPGPMFTIDVAIMNQGCHKVLLGRKSRETSYRFIGGFTANGESLEETVLREAEEEAGVILTDPKYLCSMPIDDWRYRSERDKITTTFFLAGIKEGTPVAGDDIVEVRWFNIDEIFIDERQLLDKEGNDLVGNHKILMARLLENVGLFK